MNETTPPRSAHCTARFISDSPFCWQSKPARKRIRESFDGDKTVSSALGVYDALAEIASDDQSETFQTTHSWIGLKSGLSPRTVQDRLAGLSEIGLVEIKTPAMKAPSTYTLLAVQQPLPNDKQPLPKVRQRTKKAPLPTLEEREEERLEESRKNALTRKPSIDEIKLQAAKIGLSDAEADKFFNYYESNGWRVGRNPMKSWVHALTNWKFKCKTYTTNGKPRTEPDHNKGF